MQLEAASQSPESPIAADQLRRLGQRSDRRGVTRLAGHLTAIAGSGWIYGSLLAGSAPGWLVAVAAIG